MDKRIEILNEILGDTVVKILQKEEEECYNISYKECLEAMESYSNIKVKESLEEIKTKIETSLELYDYPRLDGSVGELKMTAGQILEIINSKINKL